MVYFAPEPADVKIVDQYIVEPPEDIQVSQQVWVTLRKVLHNNGPYDLGRFVDDAGLPWVDKDGANVLPADSTWDPQRPGLVVERGDGFVTVTLPRGVVLSGTHAMVTFTDATITGVLDSGADGVGFVPLNSPQVNGQYGLENQGDDGLAEIIQPIYTDEVDFIGDSARVAPAQAQGVTTANELEFWLATNTARNGFKIELQYTGDCPTMHIDHVGVGQQSYSQDPEFSLTQYYIEKGQVDPVPHTNYELANYSDEVPLAGCVEIQKTATPPSDSEVSYHCEGGEVVTINGGVVDPNCPESTVWKSGMGNFLDVHEQVLLPASVDVVIEEHWDIHAYKPSMHTFVFENEIVRIKDPNVVDPDPTNNSASTPLTVNAWSKAELELQEWIEWNDLNGDTVPDPEESTVDLLAGPAVEDISVSETIWRVQREKIHNKGPNPADFEVVKYFGVPADCDGSVHELMYPADVYVDDGDNVYEPGTDDVFMAKIYPSEDLLLPPGGYWIRIQEVFQLHPSEVVVILEKFDKHCSEPSQHTFTFKKLIVPAEHTILLEQLDDFEDGTLGNFAPSERMAVDVLTAGDVASSGGPGFVPCDGDFSAVLSTGGPLPMTAHGDKDGNGAEDFDESDITKTFNMPAAGTATIAFKYLFATNEISGTLAVGANTQDDFVNVAVDGTDIFAGSSLATTNGYGPAGGASPTKPDFTFPGLTPPVGLPAPHNLTNGAPPGWTITGGATGAPNTIGTIVSDGTGYKGACNWVLRSVPLAAGPHTLTFDVTDNDDAAYDSILVVDEVAISVPTLPVETAEITTVWAEADVKPTGISVTGPPEIDVSETETVTVHLTLHNNGPYGPVTVTVPDFGAIAPADCTAEPLLCAQQVELPVSSSVTVDCDVDIHCSTPSTHTFEFDGSAGEPKEPHVVDPDPTNNGPIFTSWSVDAIAYADMKVVAQYVENPPAEIAPSEDVLIVLDKVIHNNGPWEPVEVSTETIVTPPAGCSVEPEVHAQQFHNVPVSVDILHHEPFTIHCDDVSEHTFVFDDEVGLKEVHVRDPVPDNDSATTELTVATVSQADVKIVSASFIDPPTKVDLGVDVDITLEKVLHNNGPWEPVDIDIDATATAPTGCTVVPKSVPDSVSDVSVSVDRLVNEVWTVNCTEPGLKTFVFDNAIDVATPYVSDPDPGNNSSHKLLSV
ncbi:MAG: hypothetical protein JSU97_09415, partial [Dehalococcoidia bacterium]